MSITCPKCQFKGLIDTAPLAFETLVACVRCGATFDALLAEGEILQAGQPPQDGENLLSPATASPHSDAQPAQTDSTAEDVLALPQTIDMECRNSEQTPVHEDVLQVLPVEAAPTLREVAFTTQAKEWMEDSTALMNEGAARPFVELQSLDALGNVDEPGFRFRHTSPESAADSDAHSAGMRLMRLSPLWLLVCGMTFISVIILSNQFARPAEQEPHVAANFTSPGNKATNQAFSQPLAPATTVQDVSQMAAPAPVELKEETKAVEDVAETKVEDEPKPAATTPSVAPVAENKSQPVIAAPQPEKQQAGGLTIQIGSYNVIEQANERVARLQSAGFDARVVTVELPKRGTWYRVQAGRFASREEAARYANEMKSKGAADDFIITDVQGGK